MNIDFFSEDCDFTLDYKDEIVEWVGKTIMNEDKTGGEINVIFCSDDYLLNMNKEYLNHDYYTDIITFDYTENGVISGDLFISIDNVDTNAKEYEVSFENELYRVIIHGILHLCGYKDKTDEEYDFMKSKENYYLNLLPLIK